ncbi:hypothetical protein AAHH17_16525 [Lysinibacillus capsici]|uniref:hypothetical protein n=1 Tax=Lysinibacillus capsici TaxID=2115968 RepID=UPI0032E47506
MAQVEVMLHPQVHTSKPTNYGGYKYFKSLTTKKFTLTELAEHVSKGKIFFPSVHFQTETITAESFAKQQLCLVDIDNSAENPYLFTEENIVALAKSFGLDVAIIYRTQSYTSEVPKFRVGFIADRVFTEYEGKLEEIHNALFKVFNSVSTERLVDTSCNEASRLFNGALYGSEPFVNENAIPFDSEALIEHTKHLPEVPQTKKKEKNSNKIIKGESNNTTDSIEAIKAGNVHKFRSIFLENLQNDGADNESHLSHFAYKALKENTEDVIIEMDLKDVYELFNHLPMVDLYSLPNTAFACIVHDDSRPSASIYSDDIDMYKCFSSSCSCNEKAHTNFMLLAHFIGGKKKALRFINTLFGIEVANALTERVAQNKAFIESNTFKEACPVTYKLISAFNFKRKLFETLESVASVVTPVQLTKDENDCSFFYSMSEMEKLMEGTIACTSPDAISQMMSFAALLGLVNKRADEELTDDAYNKFQNQRISTAERTKQEASDVRRLSVYNVPLISEMDLAQLEAVAIKAKNSGISASKMNRSLVAQAFGEQVAKLVYPTEKTTVASYKKRADVIRVKKAIQSCLQKHNVVDKTTVKDFLANLNGEMSRREFDNAYSIALAELNLTTEVATNMHRELFAKDFPRNTRISFYPETLEVLQKGEQEEIEVEELGVAVGSEPSVFMNSLIASLNEEIEVNSTEKIVADVAEGIPVELREIPVIFDVKSNRSLKTKSRSRTVIKLNGTNLIENEKEASLNELPLVGHNVFGVSRNYTSRRNLYVTRLGQLLIYDYCVGLNRGKKKHPLAGECLTHTVNQTTIGRFTL